MLPLIGLVLLLSCYPHAFVFGYVICGPGWFVWAIPIASDIQQLKKFNLFKGQNRLSLWISRFTCGYRPNRHETPEHPFFNKKPPGALKNAWRHEFGSIPVINQLSIRYDLNVLFLENIPFFGSGIELRVDEAETSWHRLARIIRLIVESRIPGFFPELDVPQVRFNRQIR